MSRRDDVRALVLARQQEFMLAVLSGPLAILNDRDDLEWNLLFSSGLCVIPTTEEEFWELRDANATGRLVGAHPRADRRPRPSTGTALRRGRQVGVREVPPPDKTSRGGTSETSPEDSPQLASCHHSAGGGTIRDGESGHPDPTAAEPLEVHRPMSGATERVAKALAARRAGAQPTGKPKAQADPEPDEGDNEDTEPEPIPTPTKRMSVKERAAAARAARSAPKTKAIDPDSPLEDDDDDSEVEDMEADLDSDTEEEEAPAPKSKKPMARPTVKGKKPASPAQIAAREAFAARSRAKAAANRKPVQTEAEIKSKQNAARRAQSEAAEAKASPTARRTARPTVVKKALTGNALKQHQAKLAKEEAANQREVKRQVAARSKAAATKVGPKKPLSSAKAERAPREAGETKTKVLALWEKGHTRREIQDELGLSYAAVFFHTKNAEGGNVAARGRIFVDDPLHKGRGKAPQVSRSEAMRRCYQDLEMSIGDIARKYDVRYQIAYTAIRSLLIAGDDDE